MARAATTTDAFNAIAEPRRRQILDLLARGERSVSDVVTALGLPQPVVSKHLAVLHHVGLVQVRAEGRHRLYRVDGRPLKSISDWLAGYERAVNQRFARLDSVLARISEEES
ncbi:MAG TPA: metalloregulator ArsR/SmtB family transcription factor [Jatrophihabitantaceae bacterium]|nr:metalloregulator ArsR/SmtB family transcription factor [Jatrophihabitantaceae bacterium]